MHNVDSDWADNALRWKFNYRQNEIDDLNQVLYDCRAEKRVRIALVRRPTPKDEIPTEDDSFDFITSGRGIGKTRLLYEFAQSVKLSSAWDVLAFLNLRETLAADKGFYELFIDEFFSSGKRDNKNDKRINRLYRLSCWVQRVKRVEAAVLGVLGGLAVLIGLFGGLPALLEFLGIPNPFKSNTASDTPTWLVLLLQNWPLVVVLALIVLFWLVVSRMLKLDPTLYEQQLPSVKRAKLKSDGQVEHITKYVLEYFDTDQDYVIIVDDLDHVCAQDSASAKLVRDLFELLKEKRCACVFVCSYDSYNKERVTGACQSLLNPPQDQNELRRRGYELVDLLPLETTQVAALASARYGAETNEVLNLLFDDATPAQIRAKEYERVALVERADLSLGFLTYLESANLLEYDAAIGFKSARLTVKPPRQLIEQLNDYLSQTDRYAANLIQMLDERLSPQDNESCKQIISYGLAFRRNWIKADYLRDLTELEAQQFDSCMEILRNSPFSLLVREQKGGKSGYSFKKPLCKSLLLGSEKWREWNEDAQYTHKVFDRLLKEQDFERIADQALESRPSLEAIDVLIKEGHYLLQATVGEYFRRALLYYERALAMWMVLTAGGERLSPRLIEWKRREQTGFERPTDDDAVLVNGQQEISGVSPSASGAPIRPIDLFRSIGELHFALGTVRHTEETWDKYRRDYQARVERVSGGQSIYSVGRSIVLQLAILNFMRGSWSNLEELKVQDERSVQARLLLLLQRLAHLYRTKGFNAHEYLRDFPFERASVQSIEQMIH